MRDGDLHGEQLVGRGAGLASPVILTQTFDGLHRLKMRAAQDEDEQRKAPAFGRRPLQSFRHGARWSGAPCRTRLMMKSATSAWG